MENKEKSGRVTTIRTMVVLVVFGILAFIPLVAKLYEIQIIDHDFYEKNAVEQQTRDTVITPNRGAIYDRNMKPLALSASVEMVILSPVDVKEGQGPLVAQGLSDILGVDYDNVLKRTTKKNYYEIIKRKVEKEDADLVREFISQNELTCIHLTPDSKRYYPYGNFASHVLGFVGADNQGLMGIEAMYENQLKGTPGRLITLKDARGLDMTEKYEKYYDAQDGLGVVLTVDSTIQHILERHLETAMIENKVTQRATGIVMSVKTGEILAISTKPDYDLNSPWTLNDESVLGKLNQLEGDERSEFLANAQQQMWRNKPVNDAYEPGSTFKILTTAMALEEKVVKETDNFACSGNVTINGHTIHCHRRSGHGAETFVKGVQNSCNPVFIAVAERIGRETFYSYMKAFGLMERTGIDLPGESSSVAGIHYHTFESFLTDKVALDVYSFGQTFKITPIQLITAVSAVANGGYLMTPHIVSEYVDSDGVPVETVQPEVVRQVISTETSERVNAILESVVSEGTGQNAKVAGYRIAGKTGTSEKVGEEDENGKKYVVSFVGYAPADDPQIAVLVLLDEPMGLTANLRTGGYMAAPVVGRIMGDILPYIGIMPEYGSEEAAGQEVIIPSFKGMPVAQAKELLKERGILFRFEGEGETVADQIPAVGAKIPATAEMVLYLDESKPDTLVEVPNLSGKTPEAANKALVNAGLYIRVTGATTGQNVQIVAAWQDKQAGTEVPVGTVVQVEFRDKSNISDLGGVD